jgi:hypothetical protein
MNAQVADISKVIIADTTRSNSEMTANLDSLATVSVSDSLGQSKKKDIAIYPWPNIQRVGQYNLATDSLIRWQYVSDLVDIIAFQNAGLANRSGIQLRSDAFTAATHTTRFQQLDWEGIPMDEPLSGTPMYEMLPINKLANFSVNEQNGLYSTSFQNRVYQLTEPWSSLYFDEADGKYQNLAFSITRNFSRKHNAELGYRQVRDGSLFRLSESEGNQIFLQNTYDLTQKVQLTQRWFSNQTTVDEPLGYAFTDASTFSFNPFSSSPNDNSRQGLDVSLLSFGVKLRSDSMSTAHTQFQVYRKLIERSLNTSTDTVDYSINEVGITASNKLQLPKEWGRINSEAEFRYFRPKGRVAQSIISDNWVDSKFSSSWEKTTKSIGNISAGLAFGYTNPTESFTTYSTHAGIYDIPIKYLGRFSANIYLRTDAPRWVELKTIANNFIEPLSLEPIKSQGVGVSLERKLLQSLQLKLSADYKSVENLPRFDGLYLNNTVDQTWPSLEHLSASMAISWQYSSFYAKYQTDYLQVTDQNGNSVDQRLLSTTQIGWKNYAFKKATFIDFSAELRNELLPFYGLSRDPLTHLWQFQNTDQIPAFTSVLDLRLSARLRSIMILVRYENAFDGLTQLGYFETLGYPAPAQRLLFSVRALFKN